MRGKVEENDIFVLYSIFYYTDYFPFTDWNIYHHKFRALFQMLFFFITCCLSFAFFYNSLALKPIPPWAYEMRLLSFWFWRDFSLISITKSFSNPLFLILSARIYLKKTNLVSKGDKTDTASEMSVLDLPDLVLESILEKLPPEGLFTMANVCTSLRERCTSAHLWEKHIKNNWSRVVGPAAYREWQWYIASKKGSVFSDQGKQRSGLMSYLTHLFMSITSNCSSISKKKNVLELYSIMSWYLAIESGKFWFPAQVYNRENGHVGFVLSCYDAELSYDQRTDTFLARYPPHGRRVSALEDGVTWDRLRASPVDTSPLDLHDSDCLNELRPGDHIEIQWRRNKEFPYGWWYGVVGHLETCDRVANHCLCQDNDTVMLEFNQYTRGSRWRRTTVCRRDHKEEGNEIDGFYGGIRKLRSEQEISMWKKLWPAQVLE